MSQAQPNDSNPIYVLFATGAMLLFVGIFYLMAYIFGQFVHNPVDFGLSIVFSAFGLIGLAFYYIKRKNIQPTKIRSL
jgi:hypothetical protein